MKHSAPFWSWNGNLTAAELKRQMRYLKKMGMRGVFMHARTGLQTRYLSRRWFDVTKACIEEGKKLGIDTWLYDEDRWPSGYAGGFVTRHKKYRLQWIYLDDHKENVPPAPGKTLRNFSIGGKNITFTLDTARTSNWYNGYCYVNVMDRRAAQAFLEETHERYLQKFPGDFPGIFTDEPQYGFFATCADWSNSKWVTVPFDPQVRVLIKKRYHYDIFDRLPELFSKEIGGPFNVVRYQYVRTVTELFRKNFVGHIGKWHKKHGLVYTGHMMGEDSLISQTWNCGDPMSFYPFFGMPGIDQLGGDNFNHLPPRQLGSAARQYGQKDRLVEMYGCTGWDYPPEGHKLIGDLMLMHGVNFRCQHLAHYTLKGESKRDCPASLSYQLPWTSDYKLLEERFDRLADRLYDCDRYSEVLVISPVESVWGMAFANFREDDGIKAFDRRYCQLLRKLQKENTAFDLGSEILLSEKGKVLDGKLVLGKAAYKTVILPEMETIRQETVELLKEFTASGGSVIFSKAAPKRIDGREYEGVFPVPPAPWKTLLKSRRWELSEVDGIVNAALFCNKDCEQLFLVNNSAGVRDETLPWSLPWISKRDIRFRDLTIRWKSAIDVPPCGYDPETNSYYPLNARRSGDEWIIQCDFDRLESRLLILDKKRHFSPEKERAVQRPTITVPEEFDYALSCKNILVLDHFQCDGFGEKENYILPLNNMIREKLALPPRNWDMVQPWAEQKRLPIPTQRFILRTSFISELQGTALEIAMEDPEYNTPFLNGTPGVLCKGKWFLDKSFRVFRFPAEALKKGTNSFEIKTLYNEKHPGLEAVYLLGDFAADRFEQRIFPLPEKLHCGDMTSQGLPFFCGAVKCKFEVSAPKAPAKLVLPSFAGALVRVKVSGRKTGVIWHAPYELDIPRQLRPGKKMVIELELVNSPRNMLGPFYCSSEYVEGVPQSFMLTESEKKQIVPLGFMAQEQ